MEKEKIFCLVLLILTILLLAFLARRWLINLTERTQRSTRFIDILVDKVNKLESGVEIERETPQEKSRKTWDDIYNETDDKSKLPKFIQSYKRLADERGITIQQAMDDDLKKLGIYRERRDYKKVPLVDWEVAKIEDKLEQERE